MLEDTIDTIWSTYVCTEKEPFYDTRSLRFSDIYKDKYLEAFKIEASNLKLLEIGCGPGACRISSALVSKY